MITRRLVRSSKCTWGYCSAKTSALSGVPAAHLLGSTVGRFSDFSIATASSR